MFDIRFIPRQEIKSIIPLVQLLNGIDEATLLERLDVMVQNNYHCIGVYKDETLIGICGLWILTKFYIGKHLEPDNVVIHPDYRNKGIGELMMKWVENYAKEQGCDAIELNAYVENTKGSEFWKKAGFNIRGHHFQKIIK